MLGGVGHQDERVLLFAERESAKDVAHAAVRLVARVVREPVGQPVVAKPLNGHELPVLLGLEPHHLAVDGSCGSRDTHPMRADVDPRDEDPRGTEGEAARLVERHLSGHLVPHDGDLVGLRVVDKAEPE